MENKAHKRIPVAVAVILSLVLILTMLYFYKVASASYSAMVPMVFILGFTGGLISKIQRLRRGGEENRERKESRLTALIPDYILPSIIGGVFAIILMLVFDGGLIKGVVFPTYPEPKDFPVRDATEFLIWVKTYYPINGGEIAKLWVWSFLAGFSERFVLDILSGLSSRRGGNKSESS